MTVLINVSRQLYNNVYSTDGVFMTAVCRCKILMAISFLYSSNMFHQFFFSFLTFSYKVEKCYVWFVCLSVRAVAFVHIHGSLWNQDVIQIQYFIFPINNGLYNIKGSYIGPRRQIRKRITVDRRSFIIALFNDFKLFQTSDSYTVKPRQYVARIRRHSAQYAMFRESQSFKYAFSYILLPLMRHPFFYHSA